MRFFLTLIFLNGFAAHAADSFSNKTKLKPVTLSTAPKSPMKPLKPIPLAAPGSTYRAKPEPVFKPEPKFEKVDVKPKAAESEMHKIKMKKLKPIDLKTKKAPLPEPSSQDDE